MPARVTAHFDKSDEGRSGPTGAAMGRPVVGLALGAGAARGWALIGAMKELVEHGFAPDIIAGTSIGAVVGACYSAGRLNELEDFARSLTRRSVFGLMDVAFSGTGLLAGNKLKAELIRALGGRNIEDLPKRLAVIATEISTGHEVWLTRGDLIDAVRASYALPGVFEPVRVNGRWLVDGALVNPVPVTVCRALGADVVVAINLVGETALRGTVISDPQLHEQNLAMISDAEDVSVDAPSLLDQINPSAFFRRHFAKGNDSAPGLATVMMDAFNITQDRISRSRLAGDPPDVMITARLTGISLFDFHRADELITIGREAARRALPDMTQLLPLLKNKDASSSPT